MLESHAAWLRGEPGGKCADLHSVNLAGADLAGANLRYASLRRADLAGVDLAGADLAGADLHGVDLAGADLRYANLRGADLTSADLNGADLRGADLDFSAWPLWCGTSNVQLDKRQQAQLLAHAFQVAPDVRLPQDISDFIAEHFHHLDFFTRK
jgi:uncharacterized protein YjbI with pentapeptide repeats